MLSLLAAGAIMTGSVSERCTTLMGRVEALSYTELPTQPGELDWFVLWRLEIKVSRVFQGPKVGDRIIYIRAGHAQPRQDRDVEFQVMRQEDGTYGPCWQ